MSQNKAGKIIFPYKGGIYEFRPDQIVRLQSDSTYTYIHTTDHKPILMAKVLGAYESLLVPLGFVRTHRSHLINLMHVTYVEAQRVHMMDDSTVEISRRKHKQVIHQLNQPSHAA
jgi:two-component system LytT family response regulator